MTSVRELLRQAAAVLLDFDGPVTPLMPAPLNREVADTARRQLTSAGIELPAEIADSSDHLKVLRYAWVHQRDHFPGVEMACVRGEVEAARHSVPTSGAHEFLAECAAANLPVAIVSNNSGECIAAYLARHNLRHAVEAVVGREAFRPDLMKPDGHSLRAASAILGVPVSQTVMVGDSLSDVVAAHSVSARVVGYGKTPRRAVELAGAGADVVVYLMRELTLALRTDRS